MPQTVIGCDLARGWIDTHVLPSGTTARIENTTEAVTGCGRERSSLPQDPRRRRRKGWRSRPSGSPGATSVTRRRCPNALSESPLTWRSARSPRMAPTTRARAATTSPTGAPMRSGIPADPWQSRPLSRRAGHTGRGRHRRPASSPAPRPTAHRSAAAAPSGENGPAVSAEPAPRRRRTARACRHRASWPSGIGLVPVAARCLAFERPGAGLRVRAAVLKGRTALRKPVRPGRRAPRAWRDSCPRIGRGRPRRAGAGAAGRD